MKIERIETGIAKKWEFIYYHDYMYKDKYKYPLREGKPYSIIYTHDKSEIYVDSKNRQLIRIKNKTSYSEYKSISPNLKREVYLKAYYPTFTNQSMATRYFAKYLLEPQSQIFEISEVSFSKDTDFYTKTSLSWMISGNKETVLNHNQGAIYWANKVIFGLKQFLDPLEFYREEQEELTPQEMTMKRLEKLLHNQHSYPTRQEALNIASALGLSGAHQMSNGNWMPGSTHQEYESVMQQESVSTPAGTIPIQNITGGSGY
tara:strand:+ start:764 stop:1543 length:780 start_codon:yes stop_codon:yes gene_type:complete